ncbi:MAG: eukaryotic-like serine/threonine-protein kinase [Actinomycetota bacterium]|nr:eukaryotic-like serine/threonine-protein kinase [Actinomycetota bacterium]
MAEVWEGHDSVLARPVAIKILHSHLAADADFQERFRREAIAAAKLSHPNVVSTYDAGTEGDRSFIVMELIRGETLRQTLGRGPLPIAQAVDVAAQVASALDHAHQANLVHRDVKPGNILICEDPAGDERVKVADFGIAKAAAGAGQDLTLTGAIVGTAKYLAPEQVEGREPDPRSDLYALGVVLYEMLCGAPPFAADTELATALLHVRGEAESPRRRRAGIPRPLEDLTMRALAKDPGQRFQTASEMEDALRAVDVGADDAEPLVRRDPTPAGGVAPVLPRRKAGVPLALLGAVVLVAMGVAFWLFHGTGSTPRAAGTGSSSGQQALAIAATHSFDPPPKGDGSEKEDQAALATDGNPATAWSTSRYNSRAWGGLKDGLGIYVELSASHSLDRLVVTSASRGWTGEVFVASRAANTLAGWGQPVAHQANVSSEKATFELGGAKGKAVLLWITDPGPDQRFQVSELNVSG